MLRWELPAQRLCSSKAGAYVLVKQVLLCTSKAGSHLCTSKAGAYVLVKQVLRWELPAQRQEFLREGLKMRRKAFSDSLWMWEETQALVA